MLVLQISVKIPVFTAPNYFAFSDLLQKSKGNINRDMWNIWGHELLESANLNEVTVFMCKCQCYIFVVKKLIPPEKYF